MAQLLIHFYSPAPSEFMTQLVNYFFGLTPPEFMTKLFIHFHGLTPPEFMTKLLILLFGILTTGIHDQHFLILYYTSSVIPTSTYLIRIPVRYSFLYFDLDLNPIDSIILVIPVSLVPQSVNRISSFLSNRLKPPGFDPYTSCYGCFPFFTVSLDIQILTKGVTIIIANTNFNFQMFAPRL